MTTLTVSAAPITTSAASVSAMLRDSAKTSVPRPKTTTACSIRIPTRRVMLRRASTAVIASAPTAGAARSTPSPQGPVCRMSRGIDRHQRRRAAEQHREEVERDRPEDRLVAPHEADPGEEVAEPRLRPVARRRLQPDRAVEDAADQPEAVMIA